MIEIPNTMAEKAVAQLAEAATKLEGLELFAGTEIDESDVKSINDAIYLIRFVKDVLNFALP